MTDIELRELDALTELFCRQMTEVLTEMAPVIQRIAKGLTENFYPVLVELQREMLYQSLPDWLPDWLAEFVSNHCPERWLPSLDSLGSIVRGERVMTDIELRELDCWIAEHFMGWRRLNPEDSKAPSWDVLPKPGEIEAYPYARAVTWESTSFSDAFQPSSLSAAFALVKREIERRGWEWNSKYSCEEALLSTPHIFTIYASAFDDTGFRRSLIKSAITEELAGCLAVKAAVEASAPPNNA